MQTPAVAPARWEKAFVVLGLFLFSGALIPLLREAGAGESANADPVSQLVWFALYAATLALAFHHRSQLAPHLFRDRWLLLLLAFVLASVGWSEAPDVTVRRCVALVGTTAFGYYLVARFSLKELLQLLAVALGIALGLSILVTLAMPGLGLDDKHAGAWRGIYVQKNVLARIAVLAAMVFVLLDLKGAKRRWLYKGLTLAALALLVLSASKTGLVIAMGLLVTWWLCRGLRAKASLVASVGLLLVVGAGGIAFVGVTQFEAILELLGKDATLTGRTPLWDAVLLQIYDRFWLGYGYGAFWLGRDGPSAFIWDTIRFEAAFAHNGLLDLWAELGLVGVALFALQYLARSLGSVWRVRRDAAPEMLWLPLFMVFMALYNVTESAILKQNSLFWILYIVTSLASTRPPRLTLAEGDPHETA